MSTDANETSELYGLAARIVDIPFVSYNHRDAFWTKDRDETDELILSLTGERTLRSELIETRAVDITSPVK